MLQAYLQPKPVFFSAAMALLACGAHASPNLGLPMGTAITDLDVDMEVSRAMGIGTIEQPQVALRRVPNGDGQWSRFEVMAAPEAGVCGVGAYTAPRETLDVDPEKLLVKSLNDVLIDTMAGIGEFAYVSETGLSTAINLEAMASRLETQGRLEFVSAAEGIAGGAWSQVVVEMRDGAISEEYTILYDNYEQCLAEIKQP